MECKVIWKLNSLLETQQVEDLIHICSRWFSLDFFFFFLVYLTWPSLNGRTSNFESLLKYNLAVQLFFLSLSVMAATAIANIVKSSLGPVGLDKMLVDDVGVSCLGSNYLKTTWRERVGWGEWGFFYVLKSIKPQTFALIKRLQILEVVEIRFANDSCCRLIDSQSENTLSFVFWQ